MNKSNRKIVFYIYWNYPDTLIGEYNPIWGLRYLLPGDSFVKGAGPGYCWDLYFLQEKEREWIYIFDYDSLRSLPWDVVRQTGRGLLERRAIDLEYLHKKNYRVVYPEE